MKHIKAAGRAPGATLASDLSYGWFCGFATVVCLILAPLSDAEVIPPGLAARYDFSGNPQSTDLGLGDGRDAPNGEVVGAALTADRFGNPDSAYFFDGVDDHITFADHDVFSVTTTPPVGSGEFIPGFSISVWMRPDGTSRDERGVLFADKIEDGTKDYVYFMGKGDAGEQEWAGRMYSADNTVDRKNRMSFYVFRPSGGRGTGSYAEEPIVEGQWLHYVAVVETEAERITWYRQGVQEDSDSYDPDDPDVEDGVEPANRNQPFRLGTRQFDSHFAGAIDDIRIFNRALSVDEARGLFPEPGTASAILLTIGGVLMRRPAPGRSESVATLARERPGAQPGNFTARFTSTHCGDSP